MRNFSTPRTYIFSAERDSETVEENARRTQQLKAQLEAIKIPFAEGEGKYQGTVESVFIVHGAIHGPAVFSLARCFDQLAVLVIAEHDRHAYFAIREDGLHAHAGKLVFHGDTEPDEDYTLVKDVDGSRRYYVIDDSRPNVDLLEGF